MKPILPDLPRPLPVIIDTDPAGGIFLRDIDDVLAILLLLACDDVRVEGITVTYGNASLAKTLDVARRVRAFSGRPDMPVLSGASSSKDRGRRTPASDFIIDYFREHKGGAALLALGPLTNLATALLVEPRLAEWIPAVVIMGGNMNARFPPWPLKGLEFNFTMDLMAAEIVLSSRLKKWIATADLCMQAQFGKDQLKRLRQMNPRCAADRICRIEEWIRFNSIMFGPRGFFPWDPVAAAMLTRPELFESMQEIPLAISKTGRPRRLIVSCENDGRANCMVPMKLRWEGFLDFMIQKLSLI